jgi:hypothetical protein
MPLMCLVVHAAEKFLRVFMFLSCGRHRKQELKTVPILCAASLHLDYEWKIPWIVVILPDCACCSLLQAVPRLTCTYKHSVHERNTVTWTVLSRTFNCEVLKTTVVLYSSTAEGLWRGQKFLSARCCVVHQRLHSGKIPHCPLSGKSLLRDSFLNLETRTSSEFLMSFSCSASQN